MAEKPTKADKLQRNVERLATRDEACRDDWLQAEDEILGPPRKVAAA